MNKQRGLPTLLATIFVSAAVSASADTTPSTKNMVFEFEAATSESGNCTPKRVVRAYIGETDLYAIRGETQFILPAGTTEIPFQAVFRGQNDEGYSRDRATSLLNFDGSCDELTIDITVEFCEYYGDEGRDKRECPAVEVVGADAFAAIKITRDDQSTE